MLIPGQLTRSSSRKKASVEKRSGTSVGGAEKEVDGQERNARARWRRETRYRQLILRFGEPRPQIGRGLNWSRGSRNRIARATPRPATYSARPRFKEPDHPISAPFLSARCPPSSLSLSLSAHVRGTGPPRYAAFVPLNQHVLVARAPVAGNRIRVFRPIFQPPLLRENGAHCFANGTKKNRIFSESYYSSINT